MTAAITTTVATVTATAGAIAVKHHLPLHHEKPAPACCRRFFCKIGKVSPLHNIG
jgi:hypothetical protein